MRTINDSRPQEKTGEERKEKGVCFIQEIEFSFLLSPVCSLDKKCSVRVNSGD
jgi:hypothetical protein